MIIANLTRLRNNKRTATVAFDSKADLVVFAGIFHTLPNKAANVSLGWPIDDLLYYVFGGDYLVERVSKEDAWFALVYPLQKGYAHKD